MIGTAYLPAIRAAAGASPEILARA